MNPHITMARRRAASRRAHSPSAEGRAPRTLYEAFEDPTGLEVEGKVSASEVIESVAAVVLTVAVFGFIAYAGAYVFGV